MKNKDNIIEIRNTVIKADNDGETPFLNHYNNNETLEVYGDTTKINNKKTNFELIFEVEKNNLMFLNPDYKVIKETENMKILSMEFKNIFIKSSIRTDFIQTMNKVMPFFTELQNIDGYLNEKKELAKVGNEAYDEKKVIIEFSESSDYLFKVYSEFANFKNVVAELVSIALELDLEVISYATEATLYSAFLCLFSISDDLIKESETFI